MKKHILLFGLIFSIISISELQANLIANAGNDTTFCITYGQDSLYLGGDPTAKGGVPPYNYSWSCFYKDSNFIYTASDFLDDTTAANPELTSIIETGDTLIFHLKVTDSIGNTCKDSVKVSFCIYTMESNIPIHIDAGDTARLNISVSGSCPPFTYHWEPDYNISKQNIERPLVWPDSSMTYYVTITDISGCQFHDYCEVIVSPVNIKNINNNDKTYFSLYPNPANTNIHINYNLPGINIAKLYLYNSTGRKISVVELPPEIQTHTFNVSGFSPGIYYYVLIAESNIYEKGKLLITK